MILCFVFKFKLHMRGINYVDPKERNLASIETQSSIEAFVFCFLCRNSNKFDFSLKNKTHNFRCGFPSCLPAGRLRRIRDSNPWIPRRINGFQDHRIRPLCQLSGGKSNIFYKCYNFE